MKPKINMHFWTFAKKIRATVLLLLLLLMLLDRIACAQCIDAVRCSSRQHVCVMITPMWCVKTTETIVVPDVV